MDVPPIFLLSCRSFRPAATDGVTPSASFNRTNISFISFLSAGQKIISVGEPAGQIPSLREEKTGSAREVP